MCDTHSEGFSYFVTSIAAPVASGWSVAGWDFHPLESAALQRRTPDAGIRRSILLCRTTQPRCHYVGSADTPHLSRRNNAEYRFVFAECNVMKRGCDRADQSALMPAA